MRHLGPSQRRRSQTQLVRVFRKEQIALETCTIVSSGEAMQGLLGRIVLGFIAAAISVAVVHEAIILLLTQYGIIRGTAWGMQPIPPWAVPRLINNIFWGGLWGI